MIDKKYLEGLIFKDTKRKTVDENGEKKTVFIPVERPLTPADVLNARETDKEMIFVTADGQKYTVQRIKGAKALKDTTSEQE